MVTQESGILLLIKISARKENKDMDQMSNYYKLLY